MSNIYQTKTIADGAGLVIADLMWVDGLPATIVAVMSAGSGTIQYSCNDRADIEADPVAAGIIWLDWDYGIVNAGVPGVDGLITPVTALRMQPVGGIGTLISVYRS